MDLDYPSDAESERLVEDARREKNWKRWGPYLSERQWATVREDYSPDGDLWEWFPHEHARSRAYRWGEDGLLGICDRKCRLCFALALWNGNDPILKERLFGLTNPEGNHSRGRQGALLLPRLHAHSPYFKALYKYPQAEFPYQRLVDENRRRGRRRTRVRAGRHRGVRRATATSTSRPSTPRPPRGHPDPADGRQSGSGGGPAAPAADALVPQHLVVGRRLRGGGLAQAAAGAGSATSRSRPSTRRLGRFRLTAARRPGWRPPQLLFTENETNLRGCSASRTTARTSRTPSTSTSSRAASTR